MPRAKKAAGGPKAEKRTGAGAKYATAEELQEKLDAYFAECEERGDVPEEFSLGVYLGVSLMTLDNWYKIADGYVWGRYTGYSGATRYIAVGKATGKPEADDYLVKVG